MLRGQLAASYSPKAGIQKVGCRRCAELRAFVVEYWIPGFAEDDGGCGGLFVRRIAALAAIKNARSAGIFKK